MKLNEQISALRRERKMSQEELAAAMNVSRQAISKWETGQCNPDTENLIRLAEIFEVDVNTLIRDANETYVVPTKIKTGVPGYVVWILSIACVLALTAAVIFAGLWQQAVMSEGDKTSSPSTESGEMAFSNVTMHYGLLNKEVILTEEEQKNLVEFIRRFDYTPGEPIDGKNAEGDILYGGRSYTVNYWEGSTKHYWYFCGDGFHHNIRWENGDSADFYYEVDVIMFYELDRYTY